jgi:hypothetical protein
MTAYKDVKFFDLDNLPDAIRDAVRPVALAHVSTVDAASIWEITVGSYTGRMRPRNGHCINGSGRTARRMASWCL